jgi:hypothetical protein
MRAVLCHFSFLALLTLAYALSLHGAIASAVDAYDVGRILVKTGLFLCVAGADAAVLWLGPARTACALRSFLQRHRRLAALLAGVAATVLLLAVAEGTCWLVRRTWPGPDAVEDSFSRVWNQSDPLLGFRHVPSVAVDITRVHCGDGHALYAAHYTIDDDGHRDTPALDLHHRRVAAFFGCSFTFGAGLADGETIPARFCAATPDCDAVNFACCGYGTSHMLALLDSARPDFLPRHPLPSVAIYTFIDHHLMRNIGSLRVVEGAGAHFPCYVLDEDGHPVLAGNFHTARPVRSLAYWLLGKSQLLAGAGFDWPPADDRGVLDLTAALIEASRDRFGHLTGSEQFLVVIYPGSRLGEQLMSRLRGKDIRCLDYKGLFDPTASDMHLADGHPSANAARIVGERLAQDIGLMLH